MFRKTKPKPHVTAVIVAAGGSSRMGENKQLIPINGVPVIIKTVAAFEYASLVDDIVIVARGEDIPLISRLIREEEFFKVRTIIAGGQTRQQSAEQGVRCAGEGYVAVHDGARPLITPEIIDMVIEDAFSHGAAAAGVPVKDTIKQVNADGFIIDTPERSGLYAVQTPQVFELSLYLRALDKAKHDGREFTDDCQLVEYIGERVFMSAGDYTNIKLTTPDDIMLAELIDENAGMRDAL